MLLFTLCSSSATTMQWNIHDRIQSQCLQLSFLSNVFPAVCAFFCCFIIRSVFISHPKLPSGKAASFQSIRLWMYECSSLECNPPPRILIIKKKKNCPQIICSVKRFSVGWAPMSYSIFQASVKLCGIFCKTNWTSPLPPWPLGGAVPRMQASSTVRRHCQWVRIPMWDLRWKPGPEIWWVRCEALPSLFPDPLHIDLSCYICCSLTRGKIHCCEAMERRRGKCLRLADAKLCRSLALGNSWPFGAKKRQ